jgi:upstream activation factor subunit UAF30
MATKKKAAKKAAKKPAKKSAPKKAAKKAAPKKAAKKAAPKKAAPKKKTARKPNAAFMRALTPSSTLGAVIGNGAVPRTEAVKKIWNYIKANNLQDKANRRMINADDKLRPLFGKDQVSMFDLAKILSKHLS